METLWPDEDPAAVTRRLSVALATVRVVLDPDKRHPPEHFVIGDKDTVRLDLRHLPVDVERSWKPPPTGLASARPASRCRQPNGELDGRGGRYTPGTSSTRTSTRTGRSRLRDEARTTYVAVLQALAGLAESAGAVDDGDPRPAVRILEVDPWNEGAHLGLVRVMERAGRHGEARRYFQSYSSRMEEIGVPVEPFPLG